MAETGQPSALPEVVVQTIDCPQCGGENPLVAGEQLVECNFCDGRLFVDRAAVVTHYRLPALVDAQGVTAALRRWMNSNETVKHLDRKSKIATPELSWFPLWMFRVQGAGGESVHVEPAAPTPISGIADLEIPAGKLEPYVQDGEGRSVDVAVPLQTARQWLEQRKLGSVRESALVHVPLWRCHYDYDGKGFEALVDGSTGTVMASVFPEKAEAPFYLIAALGLFLFTIEGLVITHPIMKLIAFAVTAVPLSLIAYMVTRRV